MIDTSPCLQRAESWPSLTKTGYDDMIAFFKVMFPHAVATKETIADWTPDDPIFRWLTDHMGACAVQHVWEPKLASTRAYWTRGVWVFDTDESETNFRFQTADQAFEFKMRWG